MPSDATPILVAVDFSIDSEAALGWAVDLALRLDAPLHVLHVGHEPVALPGYYERSAGADVAEIETLAREAMDRFLARMQEKLPAMAKLPALGSSVVMGLPVTRILEVAGSLDARLLVIGGQGRTRLADILLGSKAERILRLARLPVTVVRATRESDAEDGRDSQ